MNRTDLNTRILNALRNLADALVSEASVRELTLSADLLMKLQLAFDLCAEAKDPRISQNSFIFEASQTTQAVMSGLVENVIVTLSGGSDWTAIDEGGRVLSLEDFGVMDRKDLLEAIEKFRRETGDR